MRILLLFLAAAAAHAQNAELVRVISKPIEQTVKLPGEFAPFDSVDLRARVTGYVERVLVDRGAFVKKGQLLVELAAPEMKAQIAEAQARVKTAESQQAEAAARQAAAESTWDRLKTASQTPGAIAANELVQAEKNVDATKAAVAATAESIAAAKAAVASLLQLEAYLNVTAPFNGVVTDRLVSPGALAGPTATLLKIDDNTRLRLVVAVPEANAGSIATGARVPFTVPAYPGEKFQGAIARNSHTVDPKTRTLAVELDVANPGLRLAPGMYPEVAWPVRRSQPALLVPTTSVVTTTERTFVIRDEAGKAEWVDVKKGVPQGDLIAVMGQLKPGDAIVKRGSDEIRPGARLR